MEASAATTRAVIPGVRLLLYVFWANTVAAGILLYILAEETDTLFAWTIEPPLSAAFLGAGYAGGFVLVLLTVRERTWANARIAFLTIFEFAVLTLIVTLVHLDKFHLDASEASAQISAWLWLGIYIVVPPWMAVLFYLNSRAPGEDPPIVRSIPPWLRGLLAIEGMAMVATGIALMIDPLWVGEAWPWQLTPLTGRAIAAWLLALGLAAYQAIWERDMIRLRAATLTYAVFGVLQYLALLRFNDDVRWEEPGTWVYMAVLAGLTFTGLYGRFSTLESESPVAATGA
jgi:mannose/fructose/N-acetylgalactosamine-specific phosphotransferase system component IIC